MITKPAVPARLWLVVPAIAAVILSARDGSAGLSDLPAAAEAEVSARIGRGRVAIRAGAVALDLALIGYGYSDAAGAPAPAAPHATANRVEFRREAMTEWYVNGPLGSSRASPSTVRRESGRARP